MNIKKEEMKRTIIEANPKYYCRLSSKIYSWNAGLTMLGERVGRCGYERTRTVWRCGPAERHNDGNVNKFKG